MQTLDSEPGKIREILSASLFMLVVRISGQISTEEEQKLYSLNRTSGHYCVRTPTVHCHFVSYSFTEEQHPVSHLYIRISNMSAGKGQCYGEKVDEYI